MSFQKQIEALKGYTILMGRESKKKNLLLAVKVDGKNKGVTVGNPGSVPACVSRLYEKGVHCSLEVRQDGSMVLTNLNPLNTTYVNGMQIMSKSITEHDLVTLGMDQYQLNLHEVIAKAATLVPPPPVKINITPLSYVWDDFQTRQRALKKKQQNLMNLRSITPVFTMTGVLISGGTSFMDGVGEEVRIISYVLTGIALLVTIYAFFAVRQADFNGKMEKLVEDFQDDYKCPNVECGRFMGNQPYKILRQSPRCPHCHGEFYEE